MQGGLSPFIILQKLIFGFVDSQQEPGRDTFLRLIGTKEPLLTVRGPPFEVPLAPFSTLLMLYASVPLSKVSGT
jgi:hypothetical protein